MSDKLHDLLENWKIEALSEDSPVGDSLDYINQINNFVPLLAKQGFIFSSEDLDENSSWNTLDDNSIHYFKAFGSEGAPSTDTLASQEGFIINFKSLSTELNLQIIITKDSSVAYRVAPGGTWLVNTTDKEVQSLTKEIADLKDNLDTSGLDALTLRVQLIASKIDSLNGDGPKALEEVTKLTQLVNDKAGTYNLTQLATDLLMDNNISIYADGKKLLAPTIAGEGNPEAISVALTDPNTTSAKNYQIEYSRDSGKNWTIKSYTGKLNSIDSLVNNVEYQLRGKIVSTDKNREDSDYSDIIKVTPGFNTTAKDASFPPATEYARATLLSKLSDVYPTKEDLATAVDTLTSNKADVSYVDGQVSILQRAIDANTASISAKGNEISGKLHDIDLSQMATNEANITKLQADVETNTGKFASYTTTTDLNSKIATGVEQAKTYAEQSINDIIGAAPETLDTIAELADAVTENKDGVQAINDGITKKADKTDISALQNTVQTMITSISQADYDALVSAGTVDPKILYVITDA